ncbi:hypothetical protein [Natrarchaeobaculum aegyptiacum]|uniref:Uncharacterized protein n=1 Tax=Natrarchaeobaculum aegyptiacum TaxID=745377 RepID=A0A2Z2HZA3_9EURY|nr:hypothetical protein [Natrarchaeobaculum aegyptiacum]ARS89008.1 hypothetical protein B1756_04060 [Natrarchaeobaculum aegyptiacum]
MTITTKAKKAVATSVNQFIKPVLPAVILATAIAVAVTLGLWVFGWFDTTPLVTIPVLGRELVPMQTTFLTAFLFGLLLGGCYLLYRNNRETILQRWEQCSTWAKAMLSGWVAALSVAVVLAAAYAVGWITVPILFVGILLTWPLAVGAVLLGYRKSRQTSSTLGSIRVGYVLTRGLESRTLAMIVGLLVAIGSGLIVGVVTWYFDRPLWWVPVLCAGLLWGVVTLLLYNRYEKRTVERTDLIITDIRTPEARNSFELIVRNHSDRSIDFSGSLIRDTDLDLFRPGVDTTISPGEEGTFEIDEAFSLKPNDDALELPLGYNLKRGGETPTVFTKDGEVNYLQWTEQAASAIGRDSSKHVTESAQGDNDSRHSTANAPDLVAGATGSPTPQD